MIAIDKASWEAVSALLDELMDADGERRIARLQGEEPALAELVSALLAQQAVVKTEHFLEGTALDTLGLGTPGGRSIGGYILERVRAHSVSGNSSG